MLTTLRRNGSSLGRCLCMYCAPMASCIELLQVGKRTEVNTSVRSQELERPRPNGKMQQHGKFTHLTNVRRRLASGQPASSSSSPSTTSSSTSSALFRSMDGHVHANAGALTHPLEKSRPLGGSLTNSPES